jgi:hypothetical protein
LPSSAAVTLRQLRDMKVSRNRGFMLKKILPHHPDSEKFRESSSQFHPPQTQSYEGGFHFFI